jgi:hypothetical protein
MDAPTKEMLFKEYEICTKEASRLEANIWQTATLFSIGSGTGFIYFLKEFIGKGTSKPLSATIFLFAMFTIVVSLFWWRLAKRWYSIQHLKYERIMEIEKKLGFNQCGIVIERDNETMQHIKSYRYIYLFRYSIPKRIAPKKSDNKDRIKNYEHRGIQPAISFLLWSNAILWIFLILISSNFIILYDIRDVIIPALFFLIIFFLYFWRKP